MDIGRHTKTYQIKKFQFSYKVISPSADIISERKNATFDYKMLHFLLFLFLYSFHIQIRKRPDKPAFSFTTYLCNFTLTEITVIRKVRPG